MKRLRVLLLTIICAGPLLGQGGDDVLARARRLVNNGDAKAGRALVDSMLAVAPANSPAFIEALYWRGVLGENGERARSDLLRVVVEFPLSPRAGDALLRLAQAEFTQGDRDAALRHLQQLEREHPDAPSRAAGRFWMARILLEDSKPAEACVALRDAQRLAPSTAVELVNQIEYYARPCETQAEIDRRNVDAAARADSAARTATATADGGRRTVDKTTQAATTADGGRRTADQTMRSSAKGRWSVQVAAYGNRDAAAALARKLQARGFDARVTAEKPWRVRVGRYATRAAAGEVAQRLSSKASKAMVVEAEGR